MPSPVARGPRARRQPGILHTTHLTRVSPPTAHHPVAITFSEPSMSTPAPRPLRATLFLCALSLLAACATPEEQLSANDPFVRVARTSEALTLDAGSDGYTTAGNENFYLAINKAQLGQKWFLSAYLTQWHPSESGQAARSLGTRVVTFKIQNNKLYVFDATDGTKWSDALDPQLVVEAYPLVTDFAPFNALPGASNYVLIDPSAGLNRFEVVGDDFAASYQVRFQLELSYLQRFRALGDGVSFEQVFTGYSEAPGAGLLAWNQPFRGSGTMSVSLRRYAESAGFVATERTTNQYFGSSNVQYVPNEPRLKQNVVKWNIKPGMQPIPWRITSTLARLKADPRLAGIDIEGALSRGITGWNDAFGFPVFSVVPTTAADSFGDDDKNFIVVDTNPALGMAFANWRENPNTGEIRGASVYFSTTFIEGALQSAGDAGLLEFDAGTPVLDAGTPVVDAGVFAPCAPQLVISQVYGGNSATGFRNQDFVVLHNRGVDPAVLSGLSLQYGSATGTAAWQVVPLTGPAIPAGGYYLVGFAVTAGGTALPTVDQTSGINLAASGGKLALVQGTTALTGACGLTASVLDTVGYGATNCSELRPAPAGTSTATLLRADLIGCVDTNDNGADFISSATAPSNLGSGVTNACTCAAPVAPLAPSLSTDGGVQLAMPTGDARPALRWSAMPEQALCAMKLEAAAIPAGLTRKEFLEKYITEVILHEVGHTLGLRHNFKGSLEGSSVMDYNAEADAVRLDKPGAYDVAAVKFLYGLSTLAPTQAFCTDQDTAVDALCARFDQGPNPLTTDITPRYQAAVRKALAAQQALLVTDVFPLTRHVRGAANEAQRLEAFNALIADTAPPLKAEVLALTPTAGAYANFYNAVLLSNLFLTGAANRDEIGVNPSLDDAAFRARVIEVVKNSLTGSDGQRSLDTMRVMVDVLKAMQQGDALIALNAARASFVASRANYPVSVQPLIDDLIRRIDLATSPYFY